MDNVRGSGGLLTVAIVVAVIAIVLFFSNVTPIGPGWAGRAAGIEIKNASQDAFLVINASLQWIQETEGPCPQVSIDPGTQFHRPRNPTFMAMVSLIRQCRANQTGYDNQMALEYAVFRVSHGVGLRYDDYSQVARDLGAKVLVPRWEYDRYWWKKDPIGVPPLLVLGMP